MKPYLALALAAFVSVAAHAQETAAAPPATAFAPRDAAGLKLADFLWLKRPVIVFADSPADPAFVTQMQNLARDHAALDQRDVIVITDTDPAARTPIRLSLRPRGFSLVWVDKDGGVRLRKPLPWTVREITQAIDRTPLRRQEMLETRPAGR